MSATSIGTHTTRPMLETLEERNVPSTVVGNYDNGVWSYTTGSGWSFLTSAQAQQLDVTDNGTVYGKFSDGLWRHTSAGGWSKLSNLNVQSFQVTDDGILYGDFGASGVWRWNTGGGWLQISSQDVATLTVSDADVFYGRFDGAAALGTWRWTASDGWLKLTNNRPNELLSDDAGNLVGRFSTYIMAGQQGTWKWNATVGWSRLSNAAADDIDVSDNGTVFEDRGTAGIWRLGTATGATFQQISPFDAKNSTIFALANGDLYYDWNSSAGVYSGWVYKATTGWVKVVDNSLNAFPVVTGKDGDAFFDHGATGTWHWSPTQAFHQLGGKNPTLLVSQS